LTCFFTEDQSEVLVQMVVMERDRERAERDAAIA
jgi:hypothetical protein